MKSFSNELDYFFFLGADTIKLYRKGELESLLAEAKAGKRES